MNVENNQRYQETEKRIFQAYWKLASSKEIPKITVSDICREAEIHRTTFYGHFLDINDLGEKVVKNQYMVFWQGFFNKDGQWDFRDGMQKQMEFYARNKKIIKIHLNAIEKKKSYQTLFAVPMTTRMLESYQKKFHLKDEQEVRYHQEFFHAGLTAAVKQWVMEDCRKSPEEMAELLCKIFTA